MAVTTRQSRVSAGAARWHVLLRPRWLAWHAFVVFATVGMMFLGDWQLHRAESGNQLSWAYTFEWPLFSAFTVYFWIKSMRDEVRGHGDDAVESDSAAAAPGATASAAHAATAVQPGKAAPATPRPASWDATSWDAANWGATGASDKRTGEPVDLARATPADGEAYVARLKAEVQGRRRGRR